MDQVKELSERAAKALEPPDHLDNTEAEPVRHAVGEPEGRSLGASRRDRFGRHALVIGAVILVASPLVTRIPLAVLGGVLVVTAVKMVDHVRVFTVVRAHASEAVVFALTAGREARCERGEWPAVLA